MASFSELLDKIKNKGEKALDLIKENHRLYLQNEDDIKNLEDRLKILKSQQSSYLGEIENIIEIEKIEQPFTYIENKEVFLYDGKISKLDKLLD